MLVSVGDTFHTQFNVDLKQVKVDSALTGIVKWFNSFPQVFTYSSCQAEPFVAWFSMDPLETIRIMSLFSSRERTTVHYYNGMLTYKTTWPDLAYLERRMEYYEAYLSV